MASTLPPLFVIFLEMERVVRGHSACGQREVFVRRLYGDVSPWPPVPTVKHHHTKTSALPAHAPARPPHISPEHQQQQQQHVVRVVLAHAETAQTAVPRTCCSARAKKSRRRQEGQARGVRWKLPFVFCRVFVCVVFPMLWMMTRWMWTPLVTSLSTCRLFIADFVMVTWSVAHTHARTHAI